MRALAALEALLYPCYQPDEARSDERAGVAFGHERAGPLVEFGGIAYERSFSEGLLRPSWTRGAAPIPAAHPERFMNRPVRNRMPGGVRGRRGRSEEHTSELQSRGHLVCRL